MTRRLILGLALTTMLAIPACAADVDAPADPPSQSPATATETWEQRDGSPELTSLEMLERVEGFYSRSFNKLLVTIGLLVSLLVGLAIYVQWRQSKSFDEVKKELKDDIGTVDAKFKALSAAQDKFSKSNEAAVAAIAGQLSASETALHRGVGTALAEVGMHSATMSTNIAGALGTLAYSLHESYLGDDRLQVRKTLAYIAGIFGAGDDVKGLKDRGARKALETALSEVQSMSQRGDDLSLSIATLRAEMIDRAARGDAPNGEKDA